MTQTTLKFLQNYQMELGPEKLFELELKQWRLLRDKNGIAWALFDHPQESVNTINAETLTNLNELITHLTNQPPKGLVIRSAKSSGFIAGADIRDFQKIKNEKEIREQICESNTVIDRLASVSFPTVALVHGFCLGGGLEIALACDYRVAINGSKFGFPEVKLGLHPGLGGTVRLTRLIDPVEAMTIMLTGKNVHTYKAKKIGLIDAIIEERHAVNAVTTAISGEIKKSSYNLKNIVLNTAPARNFASRQMESKTNVRVSSENYPAPFALIDLWRKHGCDPTAMHKAESISFSKLMLTPTAQNLIRAYFLRNKLKNIAGNIKSKIRHVHIIGAGSMGGDIAAWCAMKGYRTTLSDINVKPIAGAIKRAERLFKDKHLSAIEIRDAFDRLMPDLTGNGVACADLVIEAAPEKKDLKKKIYADLELKLKKGAILATNTSSIPLSNLVSDLKYPTRFVGLHFFNPVAKMQVVEVVRHDKSGAETINAVLAFTSGIDKLPVPVDSKPGFLVNRVLMPYLMEALVLIDEGIPKESIDQAAKKFGMPIGPIELADQVGLDICLDVIDMLRSVLDEPIAEVPNWFRKKVDNGNTGHKAGSGLYEWKDGEVKKSSNTHKPYLEIEDRLVLPMLNACAACLRQKVVADKDILDAAMIFATGFAPFRGGPMHYAAKRGFNNVTDALNNLEKKHGLRFKPDPYWKQGRNEF